METEPAMQGFKNCNTWGYSKIKACNKMLQAFLIKISDKLFFYTAACPGDERRQLIYQHLLVSLKP